MRYIRKIERYISKKFINKDISCYLYIDDIEILKDLGFSYPFINGESVIPNSKLNRANKENLDGKIIIRKDLKKEEYNQYYDFDAPNFGDFSKGTHNVSFVIVKERYVRENAMPLLLSLKLLIVDGKFCVCSDFYKYCNSNTDKLTMLFNIYRFNFKTIPFLTDNYSYKPITIIKKEWEFFKKEDGIKLLKDYITNHTKKKNERIANFGRIDYLLKKSIDNNLLIGENGFEGYFAIKTDNYYIFESIYTNNATYLIASSDDWETISSFSKTKVIKQALAERYYHSATWKMRIEQKI